jgi:hypothetical protein
MKTNCKCHWQAALTIILGLGPITAAIAQVQGQDQFYLNWNAVGYTYNSKGQFVETNENGETFIKKVAADNGINPADLAFVYRVEHLDTVVAFKTNGQFVADIYQMENTYTAITNLADTISFRQSVLTVENATNFDGTLVDMGGIFGFEDHIYNADGDLVSYSYHGTFNYSPPGVNVVFSGSFSTGARLKFIPSDNKTTPEAPPKRIVSKPPDK